MAKVCDICQKGYLKANLVPRGIGRRVTRRTTTKKKPNLMTKKFIINGTPMRVRICSSCLKRIKFEDKLSKQQEKLIKEAQAA